MLNAYLLYRGLRRDGVVTHSDGWRKLGLQVVAANGAMWFVLGQFDRPLATWIDAGFWDRAGWLTVSIAAAAGIYAIVLLSLGLRTSDLGMRPR